MEDLIIIGAGPAGISAALYAVRANVTPLVLYYGTGALEKAEKIENYYGNAEFLSGSELQKKGMEQAEKMGVRFLETQVLGLGGFDTFEVRTTEGTLEAKSVILATGAKRRAPKLPGLERLEGKGVSYCAICDAFFYRGRRVAVLGNSDYALHEAKVLADAAEQTLLLTNALPVSSEETEIPYPVDERLIAELTGEDRLTGVTFADGEHLELDGLFVALGVAGTAEMARQMGAELTPRGHIVVNEQMQSTLPGLYAAGDCTGGLLQISKAVYEGTIAGIEAAKYVKTKNRANKD